MEKNRKFWFGEQQKDLSLGHLMDLIPCAVFMVDMDRRILFWNRMAEEITGYKASEIEGKECRIFAKEPCLEKCGLYDDTVTKPIDKRECIVEDKQGNRLHILKNTDVLRDVNGNITGGIETFIDITGTKRAFEELENTRTQYRTLTANVPGVVYRCRNDKDWTMIYMNRFIDPLSGYPAEDFINNKVRSYASVIHPDDQSYVEGAVNGGVTGKTPYEMEYRIVRKDGEIVWVHEKGRPVFDEAGNILWLDGIILDVTRRKKAELELEKNALEMEQANEAIKALNRELEKKNEELQKFNQLKSQFVANVSHEFKSPLTVIRESMALILDGLAGDINDEQRDLLEKGKKTVDRLRRLVMDLLDLSRIESNRMDLRREEVDLAKLTEEVIDVHGKDAEGSDISILKEIDRIEPVWGDKDRLNQVIVNLFTNAVKYNSKGGKITIRVSDDGPDKVRFAISDTGEGIPEEYKDKIFDKFERITAEKKEGTGLGLPIARDIVALHKGRLWVESGKGKGSTFIFVIPRNLRSGDGSPE